METQNDQSTVDLSIDGNKVSGYSVASFVLAVAPIALVLIEYLILRIVLLGDAPYNAKETVAMFIVFIIFLNIPLAVFTNILSIIFGIMGIKRKKQDSHMPGS